MNMEVIDEAFSVREANLLHVLSPHIISIHILS